MSETGSTDPAYRTRLQVLFASAAPRAVILRRGPKRHFNLITWDLKTDTFESGQWMKGLVTLYDLSPSGDKLIYWAAQYHASAPEHAERIWVERQDGTQTLACFDPLYTRRPPPKPKGRRKLPRYMTTSQKKNPRFPPPRANGGVWTAVSTPPYFSALAIWPSFGHWTGGGVFQSEEVLVLLEDDEGIGPVENVRIPARVRIEPALSRRPRRAPPCPSAFNPAWDRGETATRVANALTQAGVRWVEWVHVCAGDDLLFACDGRVYRLSNWQTVPEASYLREARLLADFRDLTFRMIRAPAAAMCW